MAKLSITLNDQQSKRAIACLRKRFDLLVYSFMRMAASATSWKHDPFTEGVPLPYQAAYDSEQCARLKMGFIPQEMEDKWFVYYDEPHLFFHRSWTGQPIYRLRLTSVPNGVEVTEALWAKNLADRSSNWDLAASPDWNSDYQVRLLDILVSNLLLGQAKPFPMPTGQTEPTEPKKPWWRIW